MKLIQNEAENEVIVFIKCDIFHSVYTARDSGL